VSNRYSVAAAAYELARRAGMSHEDAMMRSVLTVEEAQGGYGAGNNPNIFRNPILGAAMQFRKYGFAYAGTYYRALNRSLRGATPAERKGARRQLAAMTVMSAVFAGVYGQAGIELVRLLTNVLYMFGLKDDDWEKDENDIQEWLGNMIGWAVHNQPLGDSLSEGVLRGPTRWLQIDTSSSLGNDNNVFFGQPQHLTEEGTEAWLFKMLLGASGQMITDSYKNFSKAESFGDYVEAVPWPKIIGGMISGTRRAVDGYRSATGEEYGEPLSKWGAVVKATGFRPASEAETWEAGGEAAARQDIKREHRTRADLMARYRGKGSPAEKRAFFRDEVREWNQAHRNPDDKIDYSDLLRSERSKKQRDKELQKAMED
jgi:hypothetical protein